jgi:hypothetical protein
MPNRCTLKLGRVIIVAIAAPLAIANAQVPELRYSTDLAIDATKQNIPRFAPVAMNLRRNEIVVIGRGSPLFAIDSVGVKRKLKVTVGYSRSGADIVSVNKAGWVGDSLWIADDVLKQLVVLDRDGNLLKSIEPFNWIRPQWKDRRRYPLFADMSWEALYTDGSMLVVPRSRRVIFETPQFDRSSTHLVRVDRDGRILKTIARIPSGENRLTLHNGMERTAVGLPFFARPYFDVSLDGQRITVLRQLITGSDSGAFMLTALDASGDTVFSKRFVVDAKRVPEDVVKQALAAIKPFGRYSAEWIRDTVRSQIPVFESSVAGMSSGVDHSIWVWVRSDQPGRRALVIDSAGVVAGTVLFPVSWNVAALSIDRLWMWQREGPITRPTKMSLTRLKRDQATAVRPARSATGAASSRR